MAQWRSVLVQLKGTAKRVKPSLVMSKVRQVWVRAESIFGRVVGIGYISIQPRGNSAPSQEEPDQPSPAAQAPGFVLPSTPAAASP